MATIRAACSCGLKSADFNYRVANEAGEVMVGNRGAWGRFRPWRIVALAGWLCVGAGSLSSCCPAAWGEAPAEPGSSFQIPAFAYDRGVDIVTCTAATSSFRLGYPTYQRVYNVGFRVVCEMP